MHLKGDFYGEVLMKNLKTFISGILGLKFSWMLIQSENENLNNSSYSSYDRLPPTLKQMNHRYDSNKAASSKEKYKFFIQLLLSYITCNTLTVNI